jgi:putative DNA primase/helicase
MMLPDGAADAVALWVAHTHAFDAAQITPRLFITSLEKGSGKSSLMISIEHLARNSLYLSVISGAGVFRTIEAIHPTLLIDEADNSVAKRDDTIAVLNSGHSRGGKALRLVGPNYKPKEFSRWAPVAMAGIGRLRDTLEDRSIIIQMRRWRRHERRERVRREPHGLCCRDCREAGSLGEGSLASPVGIG